MAEHRVYTAGVVGSIPAGPTTDPTAARDDPAPADCAQWGQGERTVGVEEELLLVDVSTGRPRSVAGQVIGAVSGDQPDEVGREGGVEGELQRYMVETQSSVGTDLADVERELRDWRHTVSVAAREAGAGSAALATSPLPGDGLITPKVALPADGRTVRPDRAQEVLTCGSHVHVGIESAEEGIAVIDRIRGGFRSSWPWSANSPFSTARHRVRERTAPSSWGPLAVGRVRPTCSGHPAAIARRWWPSMVDSGVLLDDGDGLFRRAALHRYPTVEIRVADVCADLSTRWSSPAFCRALVETAARAAAQGRSRHDWCPRRSCGWPPGEPATTEWTGSWSTRSRPARSRPRWSCGGCSSHPAGAGGMW